MSGRLISGTVGRIIAFRGLPAAQQPLLAFASKFGKALLMLESLLFGLGALQLVEATVRVMRFPHIDTFFRSRSGRNVDQQGIGP